MTEVKQEEIKADKLFKSLINELNQENESLPRLVSFPNIDILVGKLPKNLYNYLLFETRKIEKNFENYDNDEYSMNNKLIGHVKQEYNLEHCKKYIEDYFIALGTDYISQYDFLSDLCSGFVMDDKKLTLLDLWVNFQKKYEFNPIHTHRGILSFVIWLKIPYKLEEESKVFSSANMSLNSRFGFEYSNILGQSKTVFLPIDESYEGVVCLFPSKLPHFVNPFYTSDDYRISISGNLIYKS